MRFSPRLCFLAVIALTAMASLCGRPRLPRSPGELREQLSEDRNRFAQSFHILPGDFTRGMRLFTKEAHPLGSDAQLRLASEIVTSLRASGVDTTLMNFEVNVPNPALLSNKQAPANSLLKLKANNIVAWLDQESKSNCVIIIGSHYDTKRIEEGEYLGANDSASSSLLLMEWMRQLSQNRALTRDSQCSIMAVWFDGEESYLPGWYDGETRHPARMKDNTYGSRYFANLLTPCRKRDHRGFCTPASLGDNAVKAVIIVDMIGSPGLRYTKEASSDERLRHLFEIAVQIHAPIEMLAGTKAVEDDHTPFVNLGIPAINIIDFENLAHWHRPTDTASTISKESLDTTGKILSSLVFYLISNPQVFAQ